MNENNLQKNKRAVIYCRVSTIEQAEEGNSLKTQQKICTDYCNAKNYEIVQVFIEQGESAKTADRTELKKLLSFCADKRNLVNAIVIYKIDRLSRNTDDYSQLRLLLKRYNVEIKSTSEYFEDTPVGRFMENTMANIAQFDNDIRTERSVGGMKEAVREGRYVWKAPLGYVNTKINGRATIAPNPATAYLVREVFELVAQNRYSIDGIRRLIAQRGLINSKEELISKAYFHKLIRNEIYAGWITQFGERNRGCFEPIITEELFSYAQMVLKRKRKAHASYITDHPDFPLRRFVFDTNGMKLTGSWSKGRRKKYPYYRFNHTKTNYKRDDFETKFMAFMDNFKIDLLLYKRLETSVINVFCKKPNITAQEITQLNAELDDLVQKEQALINKNLSGIISDELLKQQLSVIELEKAEIRFTIKDLSDNPLVITDMPPLVKKFLQKPSSVWREMSFEKKLQLQWFQFPSGVVFENDRFRTNDLAIVFKLKSSKIDAMFSNVHHPSHISNTPEIQYQTDVAEIHKNIKALSVILKKEVLSREDDG